MKEEILLENINTIIKLLSDCADCKVFEMMCNFSIRMELQKKIYLIQELGGLNLGFNYGWYLRGPYCSSVADAGFYIARNKCDYIKSEQSLKPKVQAKVSHLIKACDKACTGDLTKISWYELLASVHYIMKYLKNEQKSKTEVVDELIEKKDWYTRAQIEKAYDFIKNYEEGL